MKFKSEKSEAKRIQLTSKIQLSDAKQDSSVGYNLFTREEENGSDYNLELGVQYSGSEAIEWIGFMMYGLNDAKNIEIFSMSNRSKEKYEGVGAALHEIAFRKSLLIPGQAGRVSVTSTKLALFFHFKMGLRPVYDQLINDFPGGKELLALCETYSQQPDNALKEKILLHDCYARASCMAQQWLKRDPTFEEVLEFGVFVKVSDHIKRALEEADGGRIKKYTGNLITLNSQHQMETNDATIQQLKIRYGIQDEPVVEASSEGVLEAKLGAKPVEPGVNTKELLQKLVSSGDKQESVKAESSIVKFVADQFAQRTDQIEKAKSSSSVSLTVEVQLGANM